MSRRRESAVPEAATNRLSLILRALRVLEGEGVVTVSSGQLAERFSFHSAQIRKDLAQLGEFGVRGLGYRVSDLAENLRRRMGLTGVHPVVIAGAGHLGQALADATGFNSNGFRVVALFDDDRRKIGGKTRSGVPILDAARIEELLPALGADIGVVAVPGAQAGSAATALVRGGLKGLLNFAPTPVGPFPGVLVKNADLTLFLEGLAFQLHGTGAGS